MNVDGIRAQVGVTRTADRENVVLIFGDCYYARFSPKEALKIAWVIAQTASAIVNPREDMKETLN